MDWLERKSTLSPQTKRQLLVKFADRIPCRQASRELEVSPGTVSKYFNLFREKCASSVGIASGGIERDVMFLRFSAYRNHIHINKGWFACADPLTTYLNRFNLGQLYFLGTENMAYVGLKVVDDYIFPPDPKLKQRRTKYSNTKSGYGIKDFWLEFTSCWKSKLLIKDFRGVLGESLVRYRNTDPSGCFQKQYFLADISHLLARI